MDPPDEAVAPPLISLVMRQKLRKHKGWWVAFVGDRILAVARTPADAQSLASLRDEAADPTIYHVPA